LKTVEQVAELFSAGSECLPEFVVCQSEVLEHAKVEENVAESLEVVIAKIQLIQRLVKCIECSFGYRSHAVVRHVQTSQAQCSETDTYV